MTLRLRAESTSWQDVDGQVVILDLRSSTYLELNRTGSRLFHRLVNGATVEDLSDALSQVYGLDRALATADVEAFLAALRQQGLLLED